MRLFRPAGALLMSAALFTACDDTGTDPIVMADIAGSWEASSFRYTDASNSSLSLDIITQAQGSLDVTIQSSGAFSGTVIIPGTTPDDGLPVRGTLTLNADAGTIDVDFDATTEGFGLFSDFTAAFTLNEAGTILTWTNSDTSFDFPDQIDPRGEVDAVLVVVLEK
jgi:uncharacterized protein YhdP